MPGYFSNFTNNLWSYVSPRKTQEKRDKPFKVNTTRPAGGSRLRHPKNLEDRVNARRSRSPRFSPKSSSPFPTPSPSVHASEAGDSAASPDADLDGTTLLDLGEDAASYNLKTSGNYKPRKDIDDQETAPSQRSSFDATMVEEDANDETLRQSPSRYDDLAALNANQAEEQLRLMKRRALTSEHLNVKGWTRPEIDLYLHLDMRGHEPLLPASWELDFNTLPDALFAEKEEDAYIRSLGGSGRLSLESCEFRAQKALHNLIGLGARMRDKLMVGGKNPELMAKKEILKYMKWSLADAGLDRKKGVEEFIVVEARVGKEPAKALQDRMRKRLDKLAEKHKNLIDHDADPPALYGILLIHSVMAFIGYDPNTATGNDTGDLRTIATFNFKELDYDVWNSLAIAIVAVHAREQMLKLYGSEEVMDDEMVDPAA
ncbi:MAG: hypothetical protein Q9165_006201 [Trypethelium subeluteriae]